MAKKQFKSESKRLMDLMINSIYTNKDIFLRELISNASDAVDKLAYKALTDDSVGLKRGDFKITVTPDKEARTLTITDNGIGMTEDELDKNLGTIARSGSRQFREELEKQEDSKAADKTDIIGQFGVGFYSAFMVADRVVVRSRAYGSDQAFAWESSGVDGYTITPCDKDTVGTEIILTVKADVEGENYTQYLETYKLEDLIKKYSDYIHFPIMMEVEDYRQKPKPEDAGEDYQPEYETVKEIKTINSMVPIWQRRHSDVKQEDYNAFYKDKFFDWMDPLLTIHTAAEGSVEYKALMFVPTKAPMDFYTREYRKGLQLYSSGVLIMDKCADLLPEHFRFVQGVVDSSDFSLNISREVLQQTRQLKTIATALEKKIKNELQKLQKDDRAKYEQFFDAFGMNLKFGIVAEYGRSKDLLKDLLLFWSSHEGKLVTLKEYVDRMPADQQYIYYAQGASVDKIAKLPQVERIREKGYEILYFTDQADEFVTQGMPEYADKKFKNVCDDDALPETDEEKAASEQKAADNKEVTDFVKETLGDKIKDCRISKILRSGPVCMTAEGGVSFEMEKYVSQFEGAQPVHADRVLELNPDAPVFSTLKTAMTDDPEKAKKIAEILYNQALLIADLPLDDPAAYTALVCSLL